MIKEGRIVVDKDHGCTRHGFAFPRLAVHPDSELGAAVFAGKFAPANQPMLVRKLIWIYEDRVLSDLTPVDDCFCAVDQIDQIENVLHSKQFSRGTL